MLVAGSLLSASCIPTPTNAYAFGPEAGAQCGNSARWDLCGGRRATGVPTANEELPDLRKLEALGRMVADLVSGEHRVLVHCRMGFNRSNLVIATALTYLGMCGADALRHLQERRPGALYNENFAERVRQLPARRIRLEHL